MAEAREGFVSRIFRKEGRSSRGPWFAVSFKIENPNREEDPKFYQLGFNVECPFKEDDYIKFQAEPKDDKAMTLVEGTGSIVKNPPARAAKDENKGGGRGGRRGGGGPKTTQSDLFGEIGGYNTEDDIRRMSYTAARTAAIDVVGLLLAHDGLPMSTASGKAAQPKRFEAITEMVDKLTVEYFYDAAGGRKLETVSDSGVVDTSPDAQLPDASEADAVPSDDDVPGDAPPPVDDGEVSGTF